MFPEHSFNHWTIIRQNMALNRLEEKISKIEQNTMNNNEWQPIETAPKDGTWILIFQNYSNSFSEAMIARYSQFCDCWVVMWDDRSTEINPTHWMSLPKPPTK